MDLEANARCEDAKCDAKSVRRVVEANGRFLFFLTAGAWVRAGRYAYCLRRFHGIWLPPALLHDVFLIDNPQIYDLSIPPQHVVGLPSGVTIVRGSRILNALLKADSNGVEAFATDVSATSVSSGLCSGLNDGDALVVQMPPKGSRIAKLCDATLRSPSKILDVESAARGISVSPRTLERIFIEELGTTVAAWRREVQLGCAVCSLENGIGVTDLAYKLGFSPAAFSTFFRSHLGYSPRAHKAKMRDCILAGYD